jgi:glycosyltransferase involved in cell wall biosynthesis
MSDQPFFSVVIPTKGRPEYVGDAVYSVLHQTFKDVECIVSDNFNNEDTYNAIAPLLEDKRLRYFRTDVELNMMEHWEWSSRKASGKYVIVLADRKVLYKNALAEIKQALDAYPDEHVFTVGVKMYNDEQNKLGWSPNYRSTGHITTHVLMNNFLHEDYFNVYATMDRYFPKTLNGIYRNSYAGNIRERYGSYFNLPGVMTPDYSSFFVNCAFNKHSIHIGISAILTQGEKISNGRNFGNGNYHAHMNALKVEDPYSLVPIKAPYIYNLLTSDLLHVQQAINNPICEYKINWSNYTYNCLREYYLYKEKSPFMDLDAKNFFLLEWQLGVNNLLESGKLSTSEIAPIRKKVRDSLEGRSSDKSIFNFPQHLRDFVINKYGDSDVVNKILPHRYHSALDAAGFEPKVVA